MKYDPKFCVDKDVKYLLKECVKAKFGDCLKYNDKCVEVSLFKRATSLLNIHSVSV